MSVYFKRIKMNSGMKHYRLNTRHHIRKMLMFLPMSKLNLLLTMLTGLAFAYKQ